MKEISYKNIVKMDKYWIFYRDPEAGQKHVDLDACANSFARTTGIAPDADGLRCVGYRYQKGNAVSYELFTVGHLLNLVINVLGTFVHTSRLQYIEFFNKFYEEGGVPFRPMVPADRYTTELVRSEEKGKRNEKSTPVAGDSEQLKINFD